MRLQTPVEAKNTRIKLAQLESQYQAALQRHPTNSVADQSILYSLRRMITQLKEELILFDCDVRSGKIAEVHV